MKAAITGHTNGLGRSFATELEQRGYQVQGFSRSNGFDIGSAEVQQSILELSDECDIFINNAYHGFSQTEIFSRAWPRWRASKKIIVSVSSIAVYTPLRHATKPVRPRSPLGSNHYVAEKISLDQVHYSCWTDYMATAQAVLVRPGMIHTHINDEFSKVIESKNFFDVKNTQRMDPDRLASYVLDCILNCPYLLKEITVWHGGQDA